MYCETIQTAAMLSRLQPVDLACRLLVVVAPRASFLVAVFAVHAWLRVVLCALFPKRARRCSTTVRDDGAQCVFRALRGRCDNLRVSWCVSWCVCLRVSRCVLHGVAVSASPWLCCCCCCCLFRGIHLSSSLVKLVSIQSQN